MDEENYLCHHGVLGMKWGRRKERKKAKKDTLKNYKSDKGPKRFKVMNAANSAARSYFRSERTNSFKTYRKQKTKTDTKEARLTADQVQKGRYRVAKARSVKRNVGSVALGIAAGTAAAGIGAAALPVVLASVGTVGISHFATGAHYYGRQRKAYGGTRAKYQNKQKNGG